MVGNSKRNMTNKTESKWPPKIWKFFFFPFMYYDLLSHPSVPWRKMTAETFDRCEQGRI